MMALDCFRFLLFLGRPVENSKQQNTTQEWYQLARFQLTASYVWVSLRDY